MQKYKVEFSEEAKVDLKEISGYIKNVLKEPNIAKKLVKKIENTIVDISNNADIYPLIQTDYISYMELRKTMVGNYLIFYQLDKSNNTMHISRIMYGKRNWLELLK